MKRYVVEMALQVLEMDDELHYLRKEVERLKKYEKDYHELLNSSIKHGEHMMGSILTLMLTPGVVEACEKNKEEH